MAANHPLRSCTTTLGRPPQIALAVLLAVDLIYLLVLLVLRLVWGNQEVEPDGELQCAAGYQHTMPSVSPPALRLVQSARWDVFLWARTPSPPPSPTWLAPCSQVIIT